MLDPIYIYIYACINSRELFKCLIAINHVPNGQGTGKTNFLAISLIKHTFRQIFFSLLLHVFNTNSCYGILPQALLGHGVQDFHGLAVDLIVRNFFSSKQALQPRLHLDIKNCWCTELFTQGSTSRTFMIIGMAYKSQFVHIHQFQNPGSFGNQEYTG